MLDGLEVDLLSNGGREVDEVLLVQIGDDHILDMVSMGSEDFLLEASYWKHPPSQSDLSGHGHVFFHWNSGEGRNESHGHGNTSRGSILRDGPRGDMNVDLLLIEIPGYDPEGFSL